LTHRPLNPVQLNSRFEDLKRSWVIHALYLSPEVDTLLKESVGCLAGMSVMVDELIAEEAVRYKERVPPFDRLGECTVALRERMRLEMQAGFSPSVPIDIVPAAIS
jgi:hypothetical protein